MDDRVNGNPEKPEIIAYSNEADSAIAGFGINDRSSRGLEDYKQRFLMSIDQRFRDVEDNIYGNQKLLKEYENKLSSESDPRSIKEIERNICQTKGFLDYCRGEYINLINYAGHVQQDLLSNVSQDSKKEKSITGQPYESKPG